MTVATPTDKQLAVLANNDPYLLIALRELFEQAGNRTPTNTEEALLAAETALAKATEAQAILSNVRTIAEMSALSPRFEQASEDNLTPVYETRYFDTLADLQP